VKQTADSERKKESKYPRKSKTGSFITKEWELGMETQLRLKEEDSDDNGGYDPEEIEFWDDLMKNNKHFGDFFLQWKDKVADIVDKVPIMSKNGFKHKLYQTLRNFSPPRKANSIGDRQHTLRSTGTWIDQTARKALLA